MSETESAGCVADIDEVGELYARDAVRVRRLVALDVRGADDVVDEACQVAWTRLIRHHRRVRRDCATRWLVRVARNEAYRVLAQRRRAESLDAIEARHASDLPTAHAPRVPTAPDLMDDLVAHRARLDTLRALPDRQRRFLWMQGLGFSYAEMAGATGDSPRTVQRQLRKARRRLAEAA